jgi:hypothetical protein
VSSLSQEIGFGFTCAKKDSQPIEGLNCILEAMDFSNVSDLSPYDGGDDSRLNPFEEWGNDGPHGRPNLKDPLQVPDGPITRSRVKKIKEAMQGLVQSTWAEFANLSSKTPAFKMGLKEEELLINVIQATDGGGIA